MIYEDIFRQDLTIFIASLKKSKGLTLEGIYPEPISLEYTEKIIQNIFTNCQMIFGDQPIEKYSHTFFSIPFKFYESVARVLIENYIPSDKEENIEINDLHVFITVVFTSDNLPEDHLNSFDETMNEIADLYRITHGNQSIVSLLEKNFKKCENSYNILMQMQDLEVKIDENYTLTSAVDDFKKGIKFYQEKKWKTAYPFLKRSLLKFKAENQDKLILEVLYLIGNVLVQLKKYAASLEYFDELEKYAKTLNHVKYLELTHFMQGFCNYKNHHFERALIEFDKIHPDRAQFINRIHYYTFKGRTYSHLQNYTEAIELLKIAKGQLKKQDPSTSILQQNAKLKYDLGLNYLQFLIQKVQSHGTKIIHDPYVFEYNLNQAILHFNDAVKHWESLGNIHQIMEIHQIIGNVYGYLNNPSKQLNEYRLALENAELLNDFTSRVRLITRIIQLYDQLEQFKTKISLLKRTLEDFDQYIFIDNPTRALFHFELGKSFIKIQEFTSANYELITALNIYQKVKPPLKNEVICLKELINLHSILKDGNKVQYYKFQLEKIQTSFHHQAIVGNEIQNYIHDFWIITISGLEIFTYNPHVRLDPTLFGGFITALQCFSQEISKEAMDSFVIGDSRYIFYVEEGKDYYILARVSLSESESLIEKILRKIYDRFFKEYKQYLSPFYGETLPFQSFTEILLGLDINLL